MVADRPTGIALLQMGGPRNPDELPGFLRRLFRDPEMIRLPRWLTPLQGLLGGAYGTWRARKVREDYEAIGWSPLVDTVEDIAEGLEGRLDGNVVGVESAMRYTSPRASSTIESLQDDGAEHVLALPLYPFFSLATTGSSLKDLRQARDDIAPGLTIEAIHTWGTSEGHLDMVAARLETTLDRADGRPENGRAVLLSAHGLPEAYVRDMGDPYRGRVEKAARRLASRFPDERVELAFQSDVGPVDWLDPSTAEAIETLAADGIDELVLVPFGFIDEHVETAYEIDDEYRNLAYEAGIETVHRSPTFQADPDFVDLLEELARGRLGVHA